MTEGKNTRPAVRSALREQQDRIFAAARGMQEEGKLVPMAVVYEQRGRSRVVSLHGLREDHWRPAIQAVIRKRKANAVLLLYRGQLVAHRATSAVISMLSSGLTPREIPKEHVERAVVVHLEQANGARRTLGGTVRPDGTVGEPEDMGFADMTGGLSGFFEERRPAKKRRRRRVVGEA